MSYILRSAMSANLCRKKLSGYILYGGGCVRLAFASSNPYLIRNARTRMAPKQSKRVYNNLDYTIRKLDHEARRQGRISRRDVEDVLNEIKSSRSASATQSLMVIRCCGNLISEESPEKRTKLVQDIWNTFESLGLGMDISHYNALLRVFLENEHTFNPTDVLSELECKGIEPNRVTYQRLINRYCQMGDIDGAMRILECMKAQQIPINENVFNALILGHSRANDMESAEGILAVMKQSGLEASAETYSTLICGYIRAKNLEKVKALLEECENKDINFLDKDFLDIVYEMALNDFTHDVDFILQKVQKNMGYNHEAINCIYRLVNAGKVDTAYKLLKTLVRPTRLDGTTGVVGSFFISHLARGNASVGTILKYCEEMMKENLNPYALLVAIEGSFKRENSDVSLQLLKAAKEKQLPIRQHFFWPILAKKIKHNDLKGLYDILGVMNVEFEMPASSETIREYVLPLLMKKSIPFGQFLSDLKNFGISTAAVINSYVIALLNAKDMKQAAAVSTNFKTFYSPFLIRVPLVSAFLDTCDAESLVILIRQICQGIHRKAAAEVGEEQQQFRREVLEEDTLPDRRNFVGNIVVDLIRGMKNRGNFVEMLGNVLRGLVEHDLGIDEKSASFVQNTLQGQLTENISFYLEKLVEGNFQGSGSGNQSSSQAFSSTNFIDEKTLEHLYEKMKENGENLKAIRKQLFTAYCKSKKFDKLAKVKEDLEAENFVFTNGMWANLIEAYVSDGKLEEAVKVYKEVRAKQPDFNLDSVKVLKFVRELVANEQYDEAFQMLSDKEPSNEVSQAENITMSRNMIGWRILNVLAEKGDVERLRKFFDIMIEKKLMEVTNVLLGPLIKVHLLKDHMKEAIDEFERCCRKYRLTPWKNEIANKLIMNEDAANLQKLTDLSTEIHGEVNSLHDLMLSFLECGRLKQAKKILETPGLKMRPDRIHIACSRYHASGATEHMESLLEVTKDVYALDRSGIYYNLLGRYDAENAWDKALSLWMRLQENDEQPTDEFLAYLADILRKNGQAVPFKSPAKGEDSLRVENFKVGPISKDLKAFLSTGQLDEALKLKAEKGMLGGADMSVLVGSCLRAGRMSNAVTLMKELVASGELPSLGVLRYYIIQASKAADVESVEFLQDKLSADLRRALSFDNRLCMAYLNAGRGEEYLSKLEGKLDGVSSDADFKTFMETFPRGGLISMLRKQPHFVDTVRRICEKCVTRDSLETTPMNVLWIYHMLEKDYEKGQEVWNKYLKTSQQPLMFRIIVNQGLQEVNAASIMKLIEMLKQRSNLRPSILGYAYGGLIHTFVKDNKLAEAMEVLEEALDHSLSINDIPKQYLDILRGAVEAKGEVFKYTIPRSTSANRGIKEDCETDAE